MRQTRKMARIWVDNLTKTKFYKVLDELKLNKEQRELLILKHDCGFDNARIAIELNKCKECVSRELQHIYNRIEKNFIRK